MKFAKVFKGATGGHPYPQEFNVGDDCPDDLIDAASAVGVLQAEVSTIVSLDQLPDDWKSMKADKLKELAVALGGEDLKTKADAIAHVELLLAEREEQAKPKVLEQDGKWVIMQNGQPVGDPHDSEETAQAALDELVAKAE